MKRIMSLLLLFTVALVSCSLVAPDESSPSAADGIQPTSTFAPTRGPLSALNLNGRLLYTQEPAGLWEVDLQTGAQRQLWHPPEGGVLKGVAAAPDGKRLVLAYAPPSATQYYSDLYLADADGTSMEPLLERRREMESYYAPVWSPDGAWIYFTHFLPQYDEEGNYQGLLLNIERIAADGTGNPEVVIEGGEQPSLSADGERLAYLRTDESTLLQELWIANADGTEARELVSAGSFVSLAEPRLSPDGATVAFAASEPLQSSVPESSALMEFLGVKVASAHGLPWEIWRVPTAGGTPNQLTEMFSDDPSLAWSPDGAHLAVLQPGAVFMLGTGDPRFLAGVEGHGALDWAP
jgi:Tol biopolymer transport system component